MAREIDMQQCRVALGRAILLMADGSLRSIASSELPNAVTGQAAQFLARGSIQCTAELVACAGRVPVHAVWGK